MRRNAIYIDDANAQRRPTRLMHVQEVDHSSFLQQTPQTSQFMFDMEETPQEIPVNVEKTVEEASYLFHIMAQQGGVRPTYKIFNSNPFRKSLSIPDKIWNELMPLIKEKIIAVRAS